MGKLNGKRPLERPRHRWENNIKVDLRELCSDPGDWISLAEHSDQWQASVRAVMNFRSLKSQLVINIILDVHS